jgi:hypothetical protein
MGPCERRDPYAVSPDPFHDACCKCLDEIETLVVMGPCVRRDDERIFFDVGICQ